MQEFTQLGIAGLTLFILFFVVKYFVKAISDKDQQIKEMITQFNVTINNHISHSSQAFGELTDAIKELTKEIKNGK